MLKLSNEDFIAKYEYLKARDPYHKILPKLKIGNTVLNSIYLMNAIRDLPAPKKSETPVRSDEVSISQVAKDLQIEQRFLRQSRAELSNSFQGCTTNAERARISKQIIKINGQLKTILDRLQAYQRSEAIPELPKSDKYPVPDTEIGCYKKLHTLRTTITKIEKELEILLKQGNDPAKVVARETKLRELKIHRQYVTREIERYKIIQS